MDVSLKFGMAAMAVLLTVARAALQMRVAYGHRSSGRRPAADLQSSLLLPAASAASLAYSCVVSADVALLATAWVNTSAAVISWSLSRRRTSVGGARHQQSDERARGE